MIDESLAFAPPIHDSQCMAKSPSSSFLLAPWSGRELLHRIALSRQDCHEKRRGRDKIVRTGSERTICQPIGAVIHKREKADTDLLARMKKKKRLRL